MPRRREILIAAVAIVLAYLFAVSPGGASRFGQTVLLFTLLGVVVFLYPRFAKRTVRSAPGRFVIGVLVLVPILDLGSRGSLYQVLGAILALGTFAALVFVLENRRPTELLTRHGPQQALAGLALGTVLAVFSLVLVLNSMFLPSRSPLVLGMLTLALFQGVTEEVLFRGILLRIPEERFGSGVALLFSAALFSLVHSAGHQTDTFFAGLALGACFLATRGLWLPIGGHVAHNFVLEVLSGGRSGAIEYAVHRDPSTAVPYIACAVAITVVMLWVAHRRGHLRRWRGWRRGPDPI